MARMHTPLPPRTDADIAAQTAHLADVVLGHGIAQGFSWHVTEALLAVSRGDPDIDPAAARRFVTQALACVLEVEILAYRRAA
jgi:hypothetical protein